MENAAPCSDTFALVQIRSVPRVLHDHGATVDLRVITEKKETCVHETVEYQAFQIHFHWSLLTIDHDSEVIPRNH
jgi:hypothetical protein